nr:hypothetical protein Iba_chr04aCG23350 [Ipomoea batatas]
MSRILCKDISSYNKPTQKAGNAHNRLQGPPSAPRISRYLLSLTSGNIVVKWFSQSLSVGYSPGIGGSFPAIKSCQRFNVESIYFFFR